MKSGSFAPRLATSAPAIIDATSMKIAPGARTTPAWKMSAPNPMGGGNSMRYTMVENSIKFIRPAIKEAILGKEHVSLAAAR